MTKPGPGKFEGCESLEVAEFLYSVIGMGFQNDNFGDISEDGIYEALIIIPSKTDFAGVSDDLDLKEAYVTTENGDGFFDYQAFDTEQEAREAFMRDLAAFESYASR